MCYPFLTNLHSSKLIQTANVTGNKAELVVRLDGLAAKDNDCSLTAQSHLQTRPAIQDEDPQSKFDKECREDRYYDIWLQAQEILFSHWIGLPISAGCLHAAMRYLDEVIPTDYKPPIRPAQNDPKVEVPYISGEILTDLDVALWRMSVRHARNTGVIDMTNDSGFFPDASVQDVSNAKVPNLGEEMSA